MTRPPKSQPCGAGILFFEKSFRTGLAISESEITLLPSGQTQHTTNGTGTMTMNTELLKAAAQFLFENGAELKNNEATKNAIIGLCIKTLIDAGIPADKAFDAVVGDGQFKALSDSLWESFQAAKG